MELKKVYKVYHGTLLQDLMTISPKGGDRISHVLNTL